MGKSILTNQRLLFLRAHDLPIYGSNVGGGSSGNDLSSSLDPNLRNIETNPESAVMPVLGFGFLFRGIVVTPYLSCFFVT
jgi:hypothetical protein